MQDNLFSLASKYNVNITQSRYRLCITYLLVVAALLVILINTSLFKRSDTYLLIIITLAFSIIVIGVINSAKYRKSILRSFILTSDGEISFSNEQLNYQLMTSSRLSFFGCWLIMKPAVIEGGSGTAVKNSTNEIKTCFIYRDSINGQDFARLIKVLNNLS